jgi:hypothetical protein
MFEILKPSISLRNGLALHSPFSSSRPFPCIQDSGPDLTPSLLSVASAITGWMRLNTPVSALAR